MLELSIIDGLSVDNPTEKVKRFNDRGGIIGRDLKAEWPLYDPGRVISSQHIKVIFSQGAYYFSDLSTNGILTESGQKLRKGEYRLLKIGEVYAVGPYRIEVTGLNTQDETASFKEAGLDHILNDAEPEADLSPLQYVEKQADPLTEKPNQDFPFKQKPNTLKAFDFMPEPVDFGHPAASQVLKKEDAAIPDFDFLSELNNSKTQTVSELNISTDDPMAEAIPVVMEQNNLAIELTQSPSNFTTQFCELMNLNQQYFTEIEDHQFEKSMRSFFAALNERFQTNPL